MAAGPGDDEQVWAADKRDFVADSRDDVADERDVAADARELVAEARDVVADAREARLDRWQESLNEVAGRSGSARNAAAAATREEAGKERARAAEHAEQDHAVRQEGDQDRDAAARRRMERTEPTLLALAFASITEQLYDAQTYDEVLRRIAEAAVATVTGSHAASVTLPEKDRYRTAASTDASAAGVDEAQYVADEGPSLDALTTPVVDAPRFPDDRWPALGVAPASYGVESSLSYQLHLGSDDDTHTGTGSLNIYALTADAFDQAALEIGAILAAHASLAARAVGTRVTLEDMGHHLERALFSRDVIGEAKGILMERFKLTPDAAFDVLRTSSQRLNLKLRDVARGITETGELRGADPQPPATASEPDTRS